MQKSFIADANKTFTDNVSSSNPTDIPQKRCTNCHEWKLFSKFHINSKKRGSKPRAICKVCRKTARQANAEKIKEQEREYYKVNSTRIRAARRAYYKTNRERIKQANRKYVELNREKVAESQRRWREANAEYLRNWECNYKAANLEKYKAYYQEYRIANPDKETSKRHTRRARRKAAPGKFTPNEWRSLCEFYQNTCLCCGANDKLLTPDHVIPLSKNGSNDINNIQPLCLSCNLKKGRKIIDYRKR